MGRIIHFEIPSDKPEKAVEFYTKTFGWKISRWGEQEYWLAGTGDDNEPGINGAITKKSDSNKSLINYIAVKNIDDSIKAIQANGGKIVMPKTQIPNIGYFVLFTDPDGNLMGALQQDSNPMM